MNDSYIPNAHAEFKAVSERFTHLIQSSADPSQLAACIEHLIQIAQGFMANDEVAWLKQLHSQCLFSLHHDGRLREDQTMRIEYLILTRILALCEPNNAGHLRALLPAHELAYTHDRYVYLCRIYRQDTWENIQRHRYRAWQLRHPLQNQMLLYGGKAALTYYGSRSRRKRIQR